MKNIHLLPTDKPSRLHNKNGELGNYPSTKLYIEDFKGNQHNSFHIYITSDEEIKDAKWIIHNGKIHEVTKNKGLYISVKEVSHIDIRANLCKKIILTTDQDLIKDGVQAIDDEFLEWFVKNPSCEEVEVYREGYKKNGMIDEATSYQYKIIIPKEEPKTNLEKLPFPKLVEEFANYYKKVPLVEEPKQETLEEAVERLFPFTKDDSENRIITIKRLFWIEGAKWQAERMHSDEELKSAFKIGFNIGYGSPVQELDLKNEHCERWFEQFKKK